MATIELVDVAMRDGNQSLWGATGLGSAHCLSIAPVLDRVGFRAADFTSTAHGHCRPVLQGGPVGADPADARRDAADAAAVHHHRLSLHRLGDRRSAIHAAGLSAAGRERHRALRR